MLGLFWKHKSKWTVSPVNILFVPELFSLFWQLLCLLSTSFTCYSSVLFSRKRINLLRKWMHWWKSAVKTSKVKYKHFVLHSTSVHMQSQLINWIDRSKHSWYMRLYDRNTEGKRWLDFCFIGCSPNHSAYLHMQDPFTSIIYSQSSFSNPTINKLIFYNQLHHYHLHITLFLYATYDSC